MYLFDIVQRLSSLELYDYTFFIEKIIEIFNNLTPSSIAIILNILPFLLAIMRCILTSYFLFVLVLYMYKKTNVRYTGTQN